MAGARKSKRRNSKLRNKTRRQRGGGGGLGLSPVDKDRIINQAHQAVYNQEQLRKGKPWWMPSRFWPGQ
jgi:hypothetical protein